MKNVEITYFNKYILSINNLFQLLVYNKKKFIIIINILITIKIIFLIDNNIVFIRIFVKLLRTNNKII